MYGASAYRHIRLNAFASFRMRSHSIAFQIQSSLVRLFPIAHLQMLPLFLTFPDTWQSPCQCRLSLSAKAHAFLDPHIVVGWFPLWRSCISHEQSSQFHRWYNPVSDFPARQNAGRCFQGFFLSRTSPRYPADALDGVFPVRRVPLFKVPGQTVQIYKPAPPGCPFPRHLQSIARQAAGSTETQCSTITGCCPVCSPRPCSGDL